MFMDGCSKDKMNRIGKANSAHNFELHNALSRIPTACVQRSDNPARSFLSLLEANIEVIFLESGLRQRLFLNFRDILETTQS